MLGTVNAVEGLDFGSKAICQNPEGRSSVVKIVDPPSPILNTFHGVFVYISLGIERPEILNYSVTPVFLLYEKHGAVVAAGGLKNA